MPVFEEKNGNIHVYTPLIDWDRRKGKCESNFYRSYRRNTNGVLNEA